MEKGNVPLQYSDLQKLKFHESLLHYKGFQEDYKMLLFHVFT